MKFKKGTKVTHKENPSWSAVIIRDNHPNRPVNGLVRLRTTNGGSEWELDFPKSLLKFRLDK